MNTTLPTSVTKPHAKGPGSILRSSPTDREWHLMSFARSRELAMASLAQAGLEAKACPPVARVCLRHAREHGANAREHYALAMTA